MDSTKRSFYTPQGFVIFEIIDNSIPATKSYFSVSDKSSTIVFGKTQTIESKDESFFLQS